jgi:hypothetical protein
MSTTYLVRATPCLLEGQPAYSLHANASGVLADFIEALRIHAPDSDDDFPRNERLASVCRSCHVWEAMRASGHEGAAECLREAASRCGCDLVLEPVPAALVASLADTLPAVAP